MNLTKALQESKLSQAGAATAALANGWSQTTDGDAPSHELLSIYECRLNLLSNKSGKHARQLAVSTREFVEALKAQPVDSVQVTMIRGKEEHHFAVFVAAQHGKVLGCLKMIGADEVSKERWDEIWSDSA